MSKSQQGIIEGLLFIAGDEGLELKQIATVLDMTVEEVKKQLEEMQIQYEQQERGLSIIQYGDTFQMTTKKEHAPYYKKLMEQPHHASLSQAALETLAIVTYRQPITRMEIEEIRGVKSEKPLQKLTAKLLIKEVDRAEAPGRPILYGTTKEFLDHFGLQTLEELPPLPEKIDDELEQEEADLFFSKFQETMTEES